MEHALCACQSLYSNSISTRLNHGQHLSDAVLGTSMQCNLLEGWLLWIMLGQRETNDAHITRIVLDLEEEQEWSLSIALKVDVGHINRALLERVNKLALLHFIESQMLR